MKSQILRVANELRRQGYEISLYKRKDRGYLITKINGQRFTGAKGNMYARSITGTKLSRNVLRANRKLVKQFIVKPKLSKSFMREFRKTQRIWRKEHPNISGKIRLRDYRWKIEHEGIEIARQSLSEKQRYAKGLAYTENINTLQDKLNSIKGANSIQQEKINKIKDFVKKNGNKITEAQIREVFYALISEKGEDGNHHGKIRHQDCEYRCSLQPAGYQRPGDRDQ